MRNPTQSRWFVSESADRQIEGCLEAADGSWSFRAVITDPSVAFNASKLAAEGRAVEAIQLLFDHANQPPKIKGV